MGRASRHRAARQAGGAGTSRAPAIGALDPVGAVTASVAAPARPAEEGLDDRERASLLRSIRRHRAERAALERGYAEEVARARELGVPWSAIGQALGTSRTAAQKRYGARVARL